MARTQSKLQWRLAGRRSVSDGGQLNGEFEKDGKVPALFYISVSERDGGLRLKTSLPGNFRVGPFGHAVDSVEDGKALAEEVLREFYRALKKHMEPVKPKQPSAAAKEVSRG
ncbi:hypothetical protein ACIBUR_09435 [Streptomyces anulatus]